MLKCPGKWISGNQPVIIRVGADPEPYDTIFDRDAERPVVTPDSYRPELANLLEVKGRVAGVFLQELEIGIGQILGCGRVA
jgi:hypothetical protein